MTAPEDQCATATRPDWIPAEGDLVLADGRLGRVTGYRSLPGCVAALELADPDRPDDPDLWRVSRLTDTRPGPQTPPNPGVPCDSSLLPCGCPDPGGAHRKGCSIPHSRRSVRAAQSSPQAVGQVLLGRVLDGLRNLRAEADRDREELPQVRLQAVPDQTHHGWHYLLTTPTARYATPTSDDATAWLDREIVGDGSRSAVTEP